AERLVPARRPPGVSADQQRRSQPDRDLDDARQPRLIVEARDAAAEPRDGRRSVEVVVQPRRDRRVDVVAGSGFEENGAVHGALTMRPPERSGQPRSVDGGLRSPGGSDQRIRAPHGASSTSSYRAGASVRLTTHVASPRAYAQGPASAGSPRYGASANARRRSISRRTYASVLPGSACWSSTLRDVSVSGSHGPSHSEPSRVHGIGVRSGSRGGFATSRIRPRGTRPSVRATSSPW